MLPCKVIEPVCDLGHVVPMQPSKILLEAIALRKCVMAQYNRTTMRLAPHILYTRHDELFVDAVTVERDGQPPREIKLGSFKLTGLTQVELATQTFEPVNLFNPKDPKYVGTTLFSVAA